MKIPLFKRIVCASNLTYEAASEALTKAANSKASEVLTFSIATKQGEENWSLEATPKQALKAFLESPEDFYVEL